MEKKIVSKNKQNFLKLVSKDDNKTLEKIKYRNANRDLIRKKQLERKKSVIDKYKNFFSGLPKKDTITDKRHELVSILTSVKTAKEYSSAIDKHGKE